MGIFDRFFKKQPTPEPQKIEPKPKKEKKPSAKEQATLNNEPYVNVISMEIDPNDINSGAFELDWNDKFVSNLIRAGYQLKSNDTDADIVDRWFQNVCRHVVMETWEQEEAMRKSGIYVKTTDLGGGRKEVS